MNDLVQTYIKDGAAVNIAAGIEAAVRAGDLPPDAPLPTVRELAVAVGASPATVAAAYRTLKLRGVVVTGGRRGTRVSWQGAVRPRPAMVVPPGVRDLASGNPDPDLLPSMASALCAIDADPVLYGEAVKLPALVAVAARDLAADGAPAGPITVAGGAIAAIGRVLREAVKPGDRVAVEDPGFSGIFDMVQSLGLVLAPVRLDGEGPRPEALAAALAGGARALVLTPRAQNPTGAALSTRRVLELRRVLRAAPAAFMVIEDDHASLISGAPPRFVSDGARPRWAIARSFAKALNPDLRLAVLTGDAETIGRVEDRLLVGERWVSHILQRIAAHMLADAAVRARLDDAAAAYRRRREALIAALAAEELAATGASGLNVWLPVPEEAGAVQALLARGWAVGAGERFRLGGGPAIRITIARLDEREAPRLAADVAAALQGRGRSGGV